MRRAAPFSLLLVLTGCTTLQTSPARDPYPLAPPSPSRPMRVEASPLPPFVAAAEPEAGKLYELPDLVDLALRANPNTRLAWQEARAAAARLGLADSAYYPVVALLAEGGFSRIEDRTADGPVFTYGPSATPRVTLTWTLLDFGRRDADFDRAAEALRSANLSFNREYQRIVFEVERSFYRFDASRATVEAALATLRSAVSVQEAAEARFRAGLATQTERLLAVQERVRAEYDVQVARRAVADTQAHLAEVLGISPAAPLQVIELSQVPLPPALAESVEETMDRALAQRPDLGARLANLRAREAEVRRARASFLPEVGFAGSAGGTGGDYRAEGKSNSFDYVEPIYGAFVEFSWTLFDGFARENRVREAESQRGAAEARLAELQLQVLRHVWKAYADVKVALLQQDFALALLEASHDAYDAAFDSYTAGLGDILDLLAAERDLARARVTVIESRAELLTSAAALAYAAGDMP